MYQNYKSFSPLCKDIITIFGISFTVKDLWTGRTRKAEFPNLCRMKIPQLFLSGIKSFPFSYHFMTLIASYMIHNLKSKINKIYLTFV